MADESKIPKGRVRRSAKLGSIVGMQGARYAGTKATNVARSEEGSKEKLEERHLETAMKMVGALGQMKGAAMKLGQFASFIDTEFIPEEEIVMGIQSPLGIITSDGSGLLDSTGHPRSVATFARFLGRYVRDQQVVSWMEGIKAHHLP